MTHKFDPANKSRLEDPGRKLEPTQILLEFGLGKGQTFLDIGAGVGFFTFPAARIVGSEGRVIAVDISDEMVAELNLRKASKGDANVEVRRSMEYDVSVAEGSVDLAFMCAVLHEIENKVRFLGHVVAILKPGGRMGIVEWIDRPMERGPPVEERIPPQKAAKMLSDLGLDVRFQKEYNEFYYIIMAQRR